MQQNIIVNPLHYFYTIGVPFKNWGTFKLKNLNAEKTYHCKTNKFIASLSLNYCYMINKCFLIISFYHSGTVKFLLIEKLYCGYTNFTIFTIIFNLYAGVLKKNYVKSN